MANPTNVQGDPEATPTPIRQNQTATLKLITVMAFMALLIILAHRFYRPAIAEVITIHASCDLQQGPCRQVLPFGAVTVQINPQPIPLMQPINVVLQSEGFLAEQVDVSFVGAEMEMGINRFPAKLDADQSTPSLSRYHYHGSTILPVCSNGRMRWNMMLHITPAEHSPINVQWSFMTPP